MKNQTTDHIEERRAQWAAEMPNLDTSGMAVLGQMRLITQTVRPRIEGIFKAHGLDTGEADVLFTLLRSGPPYRLRPTELFRSLMISSGGMTHRLKRLTNAGLISRDTAEGDGRSAPVKLTSEGIQCAKNAFQEDMAEETLILKGLTQQEQAELALLLRKLVFSVTSHSQ